MLIHEPRPSQRFSHKHPPVHLALRFTNREWVRTLVAPQHPVSVAEAGIQHPAELSDPNPNIGQQPGAIFR